jgi:hypothetical protein
MVMDGKFFHSFNKQHHQALNLIQARLGSLRASTRIAEHQAREAAIKLRSRNFMRILVGVFASAAIIAIVMSIYVPRKGNSTAVQAEIGLPSQVEEQIKRRTKETQAHLVMERTEKCSDKRLSVGVFSNAKLINLLGMARQNNSTILGERWSSGSNTFNLGYWTEKENSNIRVSHTRNCGK